MKSIYTSVFTALTALVCSADAHSQANTALSNLINPTAVNVDLLPGAINVRNIGSAAKMWKNIYLDSAVYLMGTRVLSLTKIAGNTAVGVNSLNITTGGLNTAVGFNAMFSNSGGNNNTAVGYQALYANNSGTFNTATGALALRNNTGGATDNTADGYAALYLNTTGSRNTASGVQALFNNKAGSNNVAEGVAALKSNTTGNGNVALGYNSASSNNGSSNIAIGPSALYHNTTGSTLIAIGDSALFSNTSGSALSIAIGSKALYANSAGNSNTALGYLAGYGNSGSSNTTVGANSMYANYGSDNTAVGDFAGYYPSTNGTFIGWDTYGTSAGCTNCTALGYHAPTTASNQVRLGDGNVTSIGGAVGWSVLSDARFKKNIHENVPGLGFINKLRPVTYNFDPAAYQSKLSSFTALPADATGKAVEMSAADKASAAAKSKILYTGFIAQEVEAVAKKLGYDFSGVDAPKSEKDYYGLRYSDFVVPLVKAVQELSAKNDSLEARLEKLEALVTNPVGGSASLSSASVTQNTPNPFNGSTIIGYNIPQESMSARLVVTDASDRVLKQIPISTQGRGTVRLDAATLSAGTYNYTLMVDGKIIDTKKMILTK